MRTANALAYFILTGKMMDKFVYFVLVLLVVGSPETIRNRSGQPERRNKTRGWIVKTTRRSLSGSRNLIAMTSVFPSSLPKMDTGRTFSNNAKKLKGTSSLTKKYTTRLMSTKTFTTFITESFSTTETVTFPTTFNLIKEKAETIDNINTINETLISTTELNDIIPLINTTEILETQTISSSARSGNSISSIPEFIRERESHAGGFNCHPNWYPYLVYIARLAADYCAGTLLSENYVLTAGHCCFGHQITGVYAGYFHERNTWDELLEPVNVVVHGQYDNETFKYDACIIQVKGFEESETIKFITIDPDYFSNTKIFSVGYATNQSTDSRNLHTSGSMPCIESTILSEEDCKRKMSRSAINIGYYDPETMICTEPDYRRSDVKIEVDAGGPLIMKNRQIGISSFVLGIQNGSGLSFYAQVDAVYDFITAFTSGPQMRSSNTNGTRKLNGELSLTACVMMWFVIKSI